MANIFESIDKSYNRRPMFTSYELSKKVRGVIDRTGLNVEEFASANNLSLSDLTKVIKARGAFTPKMYKLCSRVLDISIDNILGEIQDSDQVAYRTLDNNKNVQDTFTTANSLFNEIIMQKKISVR